MEKRTDFYDFIDKIQWQDKYIDYIEEENRKLKELVENITLEKATVISRKMKLEEENFVMKDRLKFGYKGVTREEIEKVEEENKKLKLHIEAKDKAYTALLKDYEEIKEDRDRMKEEIEQRLNAFRNR